MKVTYGNDETKITILSVTSILQSYYKHSMSTASSESERGPSADSKRSLKIKKVRKQTKLPSETLKKEIADNCNILENLLSSEESDGNISSSEYSEDDLLKNEENEEFILDFNLISNALQKTQIESKPAYDVELREIERKNNILMQKILRHSKRPSQYKLAPQHSKVSNSLVNRKKQQQKIEKDNLILLKKIKSVKPFGLSVAKK
ncbi:PREDICTED: cilia- and flagella-associated protein 97-like [Nicrophorus vespilloides]|uniref:Cilia- and flagella-associated protein 97-like n=1 Tax=Nicrophorus vespilloides TaxID=110193 RepID=A0ABM1NHB4_NICVS|nr:PREDICTED: cilia- and flagella-associated protein 97-like [Nicrophorus vespilloides]